MKVLHHAILSFQHKNIFFFFLLMNACFGIFLFIVRIKSIFTGKSKKKKWRLLRRMKEKAIHRIKKYHITVLKVFFLDIIMLLSLSSRYILVGNVIIWIDVREKEKSFAYSMLCSMYYVIYCQDQIHSIFAAKQSGSSSLSASSVIFLFSFIFCVPLSHHFISVDSDIPSYFLFDFLDKHLESVLYGQIKCTWCDFFSLLFSSVIHVSYKDFEKYVIDSI